MAMVDYLQPTKSTRKSRNASASISSSTVRSVLWMGRISHARQGEPATALKGTPVVRLRERITLTSSFPGRAWVNSADICGAGTVAPPTGSIDVRVPHSQPVAGSSQPLATESRSALVGNPRRAPSAAGTRRQVLRFL